MTTPLKENREKCWSSRDKFWECLDKNDEANEKCTEMRKEFEKYCSKQWVKHFDRKRKYEKFKSEIDRYGWTWPDQKK